MLGVYAVNNSVVDVWIMLVMGAVGYVLRKLGFETAPMVLGLVLAPMIEMALRQSLAMSDGHYTIFVTRPIAATLLGVGVVLLLSLQAARHAQPGLARAAGPGRKRRRSS